MKTIMIVEDDAALANALKLFFEKKGYNVILASNSEETFKSANESVSVVLLDINIPGELNGLDVLKMLKEFKYIKRGTPVMMLTNQSDQSVVKKAKDLGADDYIVKSNMDLASLHLKIIDATGGIEEKKSSGKIYLTSKACDVIMKIIEDLDRTASKIRVAFVPTASDTYKKAPWVTEDRYALEKFGFMITDMDIKGKTKEELKEFLADQDMIFIAGGNVYYLWDKMVESGLNELLPELVAKGLSYIGSSAGSIVAGPNLEPYKIFDEESSCMLDGDYTALNLVDFLILPHSGREKYDEAHEKVIKEFADKYKIIPLRDNQLIIVDGTDYKTV